MIRKALVVSSFRGCLAQGSATIVAGAFAKKCAVKFPCLGANEPRLACASHVERSLLCEGVVDASAAVAAAERNAGLEGILSNCGCRVFVYRVGP